MPLYPQIRLPFSWLLLQLIQSQVENRGSVDQPVPFTLSEATFRKLMQAAPDGMVIVNREGLILFVNEQAEKIFGYTEAELLGQPIELLVPDRYRGGHVGQRDAYFAHPRTRPMAAGVTLSGRRKDGTDIPVEIALSPLETENGTVTTAIIRDITDRRRAEEALRLSEARFRRLLEAAPDGVITIDRTGRIVFANAQAAQIFGYSEQELLGQLIEQLLPERYRGGHVAKRDSYFQNPRTRPMAAGLPLSGLRKDGTEIPVEIALAPLETEEGILTTAIIRDVSERRKLDRLKEQFLSILSHELRTPINAIMGFASVLDDEVTGPQTEESHKHLRRILNGADVLLTLIDDLLDMSRIQAGQFQLMTAPLALDSVIEDVCDSLRPLAEKKRLRLDCAIEAGLPPALADPQRVRQILVNLIGNAIKFTPDDGQVSVQARVEEGELLVEVADTGIGIAEEDIGRLFIPFSQLDMSNTRRAGGTGLGLSITKSLVAAHGGRIGVRSQQGRGSTFWFTLPLAAP
ncbi:MAG: PAS domain S-box protein [Candidatus Sericytochromatia bacterium]